MINILKVFTKLVKLPVSLAIAFSTFAGFVIYSNSYPLALLWTCLGVFLLAASASAINQIQEKEYDSRMPRTAQRPIPSGKISPEKALIFSLITGIAGGVILYIGVGWLGLSLGLFTLIWYNFVYTLLKRYTPFAAVPGALTGAVPPVIGWVSAGGSITEPTIVLISFFIFLWQIPHFWILLIKYGDEYKEAGLSTLTKTFRPDQMKRITLFWNVSTAFYVMIFPLYNVVSTIATILIISASLWFLITVFIFYLKENKAQLATSLFIRLNVFFFITICIILIDKMIN